MPSSRPMSGLIVLTMIPIVPLFLSLAFSFLYGSMQTLSIYGGDSGEVVTAAATWSIAHPPGYPLYSLLGNLLVHGIPFATPAWRVGLLSSLPMAFSFYFVWLIIKRVTHSSLGATLGVIVGGFLYPVWLYAIVPEVFGLFAFFSSCLLYLFILWSDTKEKKLIPWIALVSGLSLTHHHVIILLLLAIGITLIWWSRSLWKQLTVQWNIAHPLFLIGCAIYAYAPIVSRSYPVLDWEHPASPMGFVRLISRATYGTFQASYATGESLIDRALNVSTYLYYLWNDMTGIGILWIGVGLFSVWKMKRTVGVCIVAYCLLQIGYFFYAGFPVTSDFALGTLERFFIVPYQTAVLLFGMGIGGSCTWFIHRYGERKTKRLFLHVVMSCLVAMSLVICVRNIRKNYYPLRLLKNDTTLEKVADDILSSVPVGGVVNLSNDTSVFAVYYAYYVQKKRPDIRYVSFPLLQYEWYRTSLRKQYPDLIVPYSAAPLSYEAYLTEFLQSNALHRAVMDETMNMVVSEHWVPRGLLMMYYPGLSALPPREIILAKNEELWSKYSDPLQGILGTYKHMLLADVLRYYADKRSILVTSYIISGDIASAKRHSNEILRIDPTNTIYQTSIQLLVDLDRCRDAYELLSEVHASIRDIQTVLLLYHHLYTACPTTRPLIEFYEQAYQRVTQSTGTKIE